MTRRARTREWVAAALALPVSLVVVVALVLVDRTTISAPGELDAVSFDTPLAWVTQDQSIDPSRFPWSTRLLSPWERPVQISWVALTTGVLVVLAMLILLWLLLLRLRVNAR